MYTMCMMYFMYIMCMYMCIYSMRVTRTHTKTYVYLCVYFYIRVQELFLNMESMEENTGYQTSTFLLWFPELDATSLKTTMAQVWFPL